MRPKCWLPHTSIFFCSGLRSCSADSWTRWKSSWMRQKSWLLWIEYCTFQLDILSLCECLSLLLSAAERVIIFSTRYFFQLWSQGNCILLCLRQTPKWCISRYFQLIILSVCGWLSVLLCLRQTPKRGPSHVHPELNMYEAIIVWKGTME